MKKEIEDVAYVACGLRDEGRSINNVAKILGIAVSAVQKMTTRVVVHITSEEAAALYNLVQRDKNVKSLSEFTLKSWRTRIDTEGLKKKSYTRNDDYRKEFTEEFKKIFGEA